ncbi:MAG: hypothetical protein KC502_13330 [Myxococcales bacterium]|nr:hypothetical protein [Myxococcales bacterium]
MTIASTSAPSRLVALTAGLCLLLTAACGSTGNDANSSGADNSVQCAGQDQGKFGIECTAIIEVHDKVTKIAAQNTYGVDTGDLGADGKKDWHLEIRSTGNGGLKINKISLSYTSPSPAETTPAFTCTDAGGVDCAKAAWATVLPSNAGGTPAVVNVSFRRQEDALKRDAVLRIETNAQNKSVVVIRFSTAAGSARISVKPDLMDFEFVEIGGEKIKEVKVFNVGNSTLKIPSMDLSSLDADLFTVIVGGKEYKGGKLVTFEEPIAIKSNASISIKAIYRGKDDLPHNGTIILATNDASANDGGPGQRAINVKVNSTGPCLLAKPAAVVFGGTAVGSKGLRPVVLESCGDMAVLVTDAAFAAPGAGEFGIDWASVPGGAKPTAQKPLKIGINESVTVQLTYQPEGKNPVKDGLPIADTAKLLFTSNIGKKKTEVTLEGVAANADCPTGIITVQEGETVVPQTLLHIDGLQSFAPGAGGISKYAWEVTQPKGSVALFQPNTSAPKVTFQPNVAGEYVFRLRVWGAAGKESCFPAVKTVTVLPDEAIHVELLWNTPADKDQSDEGPAAGADLDLHFAHSYASVLDFDGDGANDPWFDAKYDCFWFNKSPEWGSYDPNVDDNPSLDRDDTDGAGPENLNLTLPEDTKEYAVGVHYFNDNGWGSSVAEVRIYIYGQLQFQVTSKPIKTGDMWYVADIQWPSANIASKLDKQSKPFFVTPKYPAPEL